MPDTNPPVLPSIVRPGSAQLLFTFSTIFVFVTDVVTKYGVWLYRPDLNIGDLLGVLRFHLHHNTGFMLGIGDSIVATHRALVLASVSGIVLTGLAAFLLYRGFSRVGLALAWGAVIGSGAANWFERVRIGAVTDFLQLDLGFIQTGIFNLADLFNLGGLLFIAAMITFKSRAL